MANIQHILNSSKYDSVRSILEIAGYLGEKEKIEIYVVGGFVRDLLMEKQINDIDLMDAKQSIALPASLAHAHSFSLHPNSSFPSMHQPVVC